MRRKPRYWLFYVMDGFVRDGGWEKAVRQGIAAQDYYEHYEGESIKRLMQIRRGDWLVAGHKCRFAGYARATSDFYRGGRSLQVRGWDGSVRQFRERVNVRWRLVPHYERERKWLDLHDVKNNLVQETAKRTQRQSWTEIYFTPGRCIKEISRDLFERIRRRLDEAGAQWRPKTQARTSAKAQEPTDWGELLRGMPLPAKKRICVATCWVRSARNREDAKKRANWKCEVPHCRFREIQQRGTNHSYVEAHHLVSLARKGPEHPSNIAVVCVWHHALLTRGPTKEAKRVAEILKRVRARN